MSQHTDADMEYRFTLNEEKRRKICEESAALKEQVKLLEFESYEDFFLIQRFKKGVSASGKVDVEGIKSRVTGVYYEKIRRGQNSEQNKEDASTSEDDKDEVIHPRKRTTRAQLNKKKQHNLNGVEVSSGSVESKRKSLDANISVRSIIPSCTSDGNIRRSSRLSQKEKEILERKVQQLEEIGDEVAAPQILDLFETIVPKIIEPVRRSDWLLPSRSRFIQEKFAPIKHTPEQIKINDLIHNGRIRKVMTRFKGGLAGVRKKDWEMTTESKA